MSLQSLNQAIVAQTNTRPFSPAQKSIEKIERAKLSSSPSEHNSKEAENIHHARQGLSGAGSPPPDDPNDPSKRPIPFSLKEVLNRPSFILNDYDPAKHKQLADFLIDCIKTRKLGFATKKLPLKPWLVNFIAKNTKFRDFSNLVFEEKFSFAFLDKPMFEGQEFDFSGSTLRHAEFPEKLNCKLNFKGADLERANFSRCNRNSTGKLEINFTGSNLKFTNMYYANFNQACFKNANLYGANLNLLNLKDTDFENANLAFTNQEFTEFHNCNLKNTSFSKAYLNTVVLENSDLEGADFSEAHIRSVDTMDGDLKYRNKFFNGVINLDKVKSFEGLRYVGYELPQTIKDKFNTIEISPKDFTNLNLCRASLGSYDLSAADFSGSYLRETRFENSNLRDAQFKNSILIDTSFGDTYITNIEGAYFENSSLINIHTEDLDFTDVEFKNCLFTGGYFDECSFDNTTFDNCKIMSTSFSRAQNNGPTLFINGTHVGFNNSIFNENQEGDLKEINYHDYSNCDLRFITYLDLALSMSSARNNPRNRGFIPLNFTGSDLSYACLAGSQQHQTKFKQTILTGANLDDANLSEAEFDKSALINTTMNGANCKKASFKNIKADLNCSFKKTNIEESVGAPKIMYIKGAIGVTKDCPNMPLTQLLELERRNHSQ